MPKVESNVILIVDDNPTNLEVLSEALMAAGFEVAVATSGEGAIKQIAYQAPALVLLDVMMPGIDGFETCCRLKSDPSTNTIPILFMTALSESVDKVKGLSLGAVDYITKPFQQEEVLARIKIHLQLRHLTDTLERQNTELKHLTETLEQKVEERTIALQQTQVQLVQAEKLSSLGELVAGIAHEINNPVNFIYGNLSHAYNYTQDLLGLIQLYDDAYPVVNPLVKQRIAEIDLDFIVEDLPKILSSMKVGADRIRQIVLSLRNFSRLDESEVKSVDIHEGIESTLLILQNRLKARTNHPAIDVIKDYGDLPLVECYAGQLNQVFMNLLSNAIDALDSQPTPPPGSTVNKRSSRILIRTRLVADQTNPNLFNTVRIQIEDNGPGMTEAVKQKLFKPFFTTKPAGKGTGIGLSISHQIVVEKHKGSLQCFSQPGHGSEFRIEIPVRQLDSGSRPSLLEA